MKPSNYAVDANDTRLQMVLSAARPWTRHVEVHKTGSCAEYLEVMGNVPSRSEERFCTNYKLYIMMTWYKHCFHMFDATGEHYDLFVLTRPDIGTLRPVRWESISTSRITFQRLHGVRALDWFYVVPAQVLPSYWATVLNIYARKGGCKYIKEERCSGRGLPDYTIFPKSIGREDCRCQGKDNGNWCGPEACKNITRYDFAQVWEDILGINIPMRSALEVNCSRLLPAQGDFCDACKKLVNDSRCSSLRKKWCIDDSVVSHRKRCS